ncbi:unnamed protein product, partial [Rotaria sp. Silwood1]
RTALNIPARVIHNELYSVHDDQAPSFRIIKRWNKLFREGREEVEDEARSGRPITETTYENIEQVRLPIDDDRYMTIEETTGPVLIHCIERGQTVDHLYYIDNCLRRLVNEIKQQRPSFGTHGIKLLHDNGKPHIHKTVSDYLESKDITIIPHPPNSPDLTPCDFWLFSLIKQKIGDQNDAESLHDAVTAFMYSLNREEYKKTLDKWVQRM